MGKGIVQNVSIEIMAALQSVLAAEERIKEHDGRFSNVRKRRETVDSRLSKLEKELAAVEKDIERATIGTATGASASGELAEARKKRETLEEERKNLQEEADLLEFGARKMREEGSDALRWLRDGKKNVYAAMYHQLYKEIITDDFKRSMALLYQLRMYASYMGGDVVYEMFCSDTFPRQLLLNEKAKAEIEAFIEEGKASLWVAEGAESSAETQPGALFEKE